MATKSTDRSIKLSTLLWIVLVLACAGAEVYRIYEHRQLSKKYKNELISNDSLELVIADRKLVLDSIYRRDTVYVTKYRNNKKASYERHTNYNNLDSNGVLEFFNFWTGRDVPITDYDK